ncbi:hypothetical protein COU61_00750 [Candidatus Pacearchaeota archaeon CG10_big_fil_rev_8_21_14_0_10_35_13]|nr:MAG: hypothetical protein COU61_00750 [Candidatus Pacearchaeota archaeon CG10_big_fil_rev_8_21_14_0_10_35_13]
MNIRKRGEMSMSYTISIILLILAFAVIMMVYYRVDFKGDINREACHQSILERGTFNLGIFEVGKEIPLRCQTEYACLSTNGGECPEINNFLKGKKRDVEKVSITKDKAKEQILDYLSEEIFSCHSMLGEGKVDFMAHTTGSEHSCFECKRIELSKETRETIGEITNEELYNYLERKKTNTGETYLHYIYGISLAQAYDLVRKTKESGIGTTIMRKEYEGSYEIIAQIISKSTTSSWVQAGAAVAGVLLLAVPVAGWGVLAIGGAAGVGGMVLVNENPSFKYGDESYTYIEPTVLPYNSNALNGFGCQKYEMEE